MLQISQADFIRLSNFVHQNFGLDLSKKKQLVESRLTSTVQSMGYHNFKEYVDYILTTRNQNHINHMLNRLTTNYTYFMREKDHFDFFCHTILPYLEQKNRNSKVLSIWSAGCSSGEEPYTLTMLIKDFFGGKETVWDTRILATDISQDVLSKAAKGEYPLNSISDIPTHWKTKYFTIDRNKSTATVKKPVRDNVIFRTFNLMNPIQFKIPFDVIFCRNVMIYFDQPTKDALIQRFYQATNPGGYLLIGHSESINRMSTAYQYVMPSVYRKP